MEKKNATIKGKHASIYLHNIDKGCEYYALYKDYERQGPLPIGGYINYTIQELKDAIKYKEGRLDAWPRKKRYTFNTYKPYKVVFEICWTDPSGKLQSTIYESKHCKLKYAKKNLNRLYKLYSDKYNIKQAYIYENEYFVYSKLQEA